MKYQAVIFDLDGTLLNTLEDLYLATNYALAKFNLPKRSFEEVRTFVGNGVKVLIEKAVPKEFNNSDEVLKVFKEYYLVHANDHTHIYEGINTLLNSLKNKGIKLGVASNKFDEAVKELIELYFPNVFDYVCGESPTRPKKPNPKMLYDIMDYLQTTKDNTLYVGDSEVDIMTGKNACIKTIACLYGFRRLEELISFEPDYIINNPLELLRIV